MSSLLFELGTEEIPAGYIRPALRDMEERFLGAMREKRLTVGAVHTTGTARRLTLFADGLPESQADLETLVQGPPANVAFDKEGQPTRAATAFAAAQKVEVGALIVRGPLEGRPGRGTYCFAVRKEAGLPAAEVLPGVLEEVARVAFPKSMRWHRSGARFARPVRNVVALFDDACLKVELFGLQAGRESLGHPFLAPGPVKLERADYDDYCARMRKARVLADIGEREKVIRGLLEKRAPNVAREELLQEVLMLVEWPSLVEGSFDEAFLVVPAPVIEAAMVEHQRYFPIGDAQGKLLPRFLAIADRGDGEIASDAALIRQGNERVLRARLSDARHFWHADSRATLAERVEQLSQIQFLAGLGTYRDKAGRLVELVGWIAEQSGQSADARKWAERAALLCKSDLLTEMVGEFPTLQGTVGRLYAVRDGEPDGVAQAIGEHYLPRGSDQLPASAAGKLLALAEKMDNLAGGFALELAPTGSQDPYALRRQAQAAIRLTESLRGVRLDQLAGAALMLVERLRGAADEDEREKAFRTLKGFIRDRMYQLCLDRGAPHDIARAAMASGWEDPADLADRLAALVQLVKRVEWPRLVEVVERTFNIGKNATAGDVDEAALEMEEEKKVWRLYTRHADEIRRLIEGGRYLEACLRFAEVFAEPVHVFFEKVFVNVEDARLKNNRLALMKKVNALFSERIADLSQIVTGVEK